MKKHWIIVIGLVATITLTACSAQSPQAEEAGFVLILSPADGAQFTVGEAIDVHTKIGDPQGVVGVQLLVNGKLVKDDRLSPPMTESEIHQSWIPKQPGNYHLQVSIERSGSGYLVSNPVNLVVVISQPTISPTLIENIATSTKESIISPTVTWTLAPSATFTESASPTPEIPIVEATKDSNCRSGPGKEYPVINWLKTGEIAPIVGRRKDNTYWVIEISRRQCWIWDGLVSVSGDVDSVPIFSDPPKPKAQACHDYLDYDSCMSDPAGIGGCTWNATKNICKP